MSIGNGRSCQYVGVEQLSNGYYSVMFLWEFRMTHWLVIVCPSTFATCYEYCVSAELALYKSVPLFILYYF